MVSTTYFDNLKIGAPVSHMCDNFSTINAASGAVLVIQHCISIYSNTLKSASAVLEAVLLGVGIASTHLVQ